MRERIDEQMQKSVSADQLMQILADYPTVVYRLGELEKEHASLEVRYDGLEKKYNALFNRGLGMAIVLAALVGFLGYMMTLIVSAWSKKFGG